MKLSTALSIELWMWSLVDKKIAQAVLRLTEDIFDRTAPTPESRQMADDFNSVSNAEETDTLA